MGHFQAACGHTKWITCFARWFSGKHGRTLLLGWGDMVHLMLCMPEQEREDPVGSWSAVLPNVKQAHTVKKPKLCLAYARDQPWHIRKSDDPAVLGFQHRTLNSLWPALQETQAVPGFFSSKCLAVVWGPASGIPLRLEVKTHWKSAASSSLLLKRLWAVFSVWNSLGKEIQSHMFPQSVVWHLSFSFFSSKGEPWVHLPHLKRRDLQKIIPSPTTFSSAPNVISSADGFRACHKQYCNGW